MLFSTKTIFSQTKRPLMRKLNRSTTSNIRALLSTGISTREVAKKLGTSQTTVMRCRAITDIPNINIASGRPRSISKKAIMHMLCGFKNASLRTSTDGRKYLANIHNVSVSGETIRNTLLSNMLKCYVRRQIPRLSIRHKIVRLNFATSGLALPETFWKHVIFSDESKFNLYGPDGVKKMLRIPGLPLRDCDIRPVVKFGGGSIMVWGAITYGGVGPLIKVEGLMNSKQYIHIVNRGYHDKSEMIFQQDNDPKHTARVTRDWFSRQDINVLEWPSCSPDLNSIEHVWNDINFRVRASLPPPRNMTELWEKLQEEWYNTPVTYIQELFRSMPRRLEAVKRAKGGNTKY